MKLSQVTRLILACQREFRKMARDGYERIDGPWDIHRGARYDCRIVDAKVSRDGKHVFVKIERK